MSSHIFIANASSDTATAERVVQMLEAARLRCWMMPRDVTPGMSYGDAIVEAIDAALVCVVLVFAAGNDSSELKDVVLLALERQASTQLPIRAFRIDDVSTDRGAGFLLKIAGIDLEPLPDDLSTLPAIIEKDISSRQSAPPVSPGRRGFANFSLSSVVERRQQQQQQQQRQQQGSEQWPTEPDASAEGAAPLAEPISLSLIEGRIGSPQPMEALPDEPLEMSAPPGAMPPARRRKLRAPVASAPTDAVEFGVAHPASVAHDQPFTLGVWLFKRDERGQAEERALAAQDNARFLSQGSAAIARGTAIAIALQIEGWRIEPQAQTVLWTGDITNVAFLARPDPARIGNATSCIGECKITAGGIRIAQIFFTLKLSAHSSASMAMAAGAPFKSAFASYASGDRRRVLARVQGIEKLGVKVFMDVHDLKPGAPYNEELFRSIDRSDVLYLFWSRQARQSAYVEREWRYGLEKRGIAFIDPVPLVDPRKVPPPAELAGEKHFADWTLAFIEYEKAASLLARLRGWIAGD